MNRGTVTKWRKADLWPPRQMNPKIPSEPPTPQRQPRTTCLTISQRRKLNYPATKKTTNQKQRISPWRQLVRPQLPSLSPTAPQNSPKETRRTEWTSVVLPNDTYLRKTTWNTTNSQQPQSQLQHSPRKNHALSITQQIAAYLLSPRLPAAARNNQWQ